MVRYCDMHLHRHGRQCGKERRPVRLCAGKKRSLWRKHSERKRERLSDTGAGVRSPVMHYTGRPAAKEAGAYMRHAVIISANGHKILPV